MNSKYLKFYCRWDLVNSVWAQSKAEKAVSYKNSYFDRILIMDNTLEYSPCKC